MRLFDGDVTSGNGWEQKNVRTKECVSECFRVSILIALAV